MTYRKIDTSKVKPELDFEQIQKDLEKFKNHTCAIPTKMDTEKLQKTE